MTDQHAKYLALLRGMLSPTWQMPSVRKIERAIRELIEDTPTEAVEPPAISSTENRRRLTALIAAGTKLAAADSLVKEATIDIARSGLLPREDLRKIIEAIDAYGVRVEAAIELIP